MKVTPALIEELHALKKQVEDIEKTLKAKVIQVLKDISQIEHGRTPYFNCVEDITYQNEFVSGVEVISRSCLCCSDEYTDFLFPLSYLFEDFWKEELKKKVEKEKEEEQKEEEERKQKEEAFQEMEEKLELQRLIQKYGNPKTD